MPCFQSLCNGLSCWFGRIRCWFAMHGSSQEEFDCIVTSRLTCLPYSINPINRVLFKCFYTRMTDQPVADCCFPNTQNLTRFFIYKNCMKEKKFGLKWRYVILRKIYQYFNIFFQIRNICVSFRSLLMDPRQDQRLESSLETEKGQGTSSVASATRLAKPNSSGHQDFLTRLATTPTPGPSHLILLKPARRSPASQN